MEQLSKDMALLWEALKEGAGGGPNAERLLQPTDLEAELTVRKAPVEPITARPSDEWLAYLNDTAISSTLT